MGLLGGAIGPYDGAVERFEMEIYFTFDSAIGAEPKPYRPAGWSDSLVVLAAGTHTDDIDFEPTDTLYVDFAVINDGECWALDSTAVLKVDGVIEAYRWTPLKMDVGEYVSRTDINLGTLNAGEHTIEVVVDSHDSLDEINGELQCVLQGHLNVRSEIHGIKWQDDNPNGTRDSAIPNSPDYEPPLESWVIYLENQDASYTPGEPVTVTDFYGEYSFDSLPTAAPPLAYWTLQEILRQLRVQLDWKHYRQCDRGGRGNPTDGRIDGAIEFDGDADYVEIDTDLLAPREGDWSFSAWFADCR